MQTLRSARRRWSTASLSAASWRLHELGRPNDGHRRGHGSGPRWPRRSDACRTYAGRLLVRPLDRRPAGVVDPIWSIGGCSATGGVVMAVPDGSSPRTLLEQLVRDG